MRSLVPGSLSINSGSSSAPPGAEDSSPGRQPWGKWPSPRLGRPSPARAGEGTGVRDGSRTHGSRRGLDSAAPAGAAEPTWPHLVNITNFIYKMLRPLLVVLAAACAAPAAEVADCHLVPGWEQQGGARHFTPDNLFEYLDGSAEGYILYGLVQMQGVTCHSGRDSIAIDVFEMNDADSAYGVFTANLDPQVPTEKLGMGGQILARRALFSKGKYYLELSANPEKGQEAALRAFASAAEKRITGRSAPPAALSWFPTANLASVRLIPESVLGLRLLKRGFVAHYDTGQAFVVTEESPESAAAVLGKLRQRFGEAAPAKVADEAFEADDQYLGGLCMFRKGRYIGGFANMPAAKDATAQAASLAERIPGN